MLGIHFENSPVEDGDANGNLNKILLHYERSRIYVKWVFFPTLRENKVEAKVSWKILL